MESIKVFLKNFFPVYFKKSTFHYIYFIFIKVFKILKYFMKCTFFYYVKYDELKNEKINKDCILYILKGII